MEANRIVETCLYVDDLDAAARFYNEVLGLQPFASVEGRHLFYRCGASVLLLFNPDETAKGAGSAPAHGAHGPGHLAFAMADDQIDAWRRQLAEHGIPVETEVTWPGGGFSLYFRDPAGNSLELTTPRTWGLD
ncbi:MAG: VOC family protein [Anaerolineae bacterium]|nr:VOC family protein [Anaerolineae bacterium]MCB9131869.1 VOC family protein [Anaerolineales bacterium]MCB0235043.1 VOC family protein [Anaerolineae bacterium]MCB0243341.1 VOC family protein [Anaerolineae bacterium]MCB0249554.1 VOC family protein [Anaerolineae bacterium]